MKKLGSILFLTAVLLSYCTGQSTGCSTGTHQDSRRSLLLCRREESRSLQRASAQTRGSSSDREGIVVVDTLISSKEAQRFIADIRAVSDKPVRYVVNTHEHLDHSLGNSDFIRLGAVVVSHANCKKNAEAAAATILRKATNYGLTDEMMQGTKTAEASLTFTDKMEIDLGDRKVELIYAGPSHTDGSILVYVPDTKTLFAGDILFTNFHPNMRDADVKSWISVLDYISTMDDSLHNPGTRTSLHKKGRFGDEAVPDDL